MVGKVEKIRPQFINRGERDNDENISAKDRYMRVYSFSIEERERERERERESPVSSAVRLQNQVDQRHQNQK